MKSIPSFALPIHTDEVDEEEEEEEEEEWREEKRGGLEIRR